MSVQRCLLFNSTAKAENSCYCLHLTGVIVIQCSFLRGRELISLLCSLLVYCIVVVSSTIANWGKLEYSSFEWGHLQNWCLDCCYKSRSTNSLQELLLSRIFSKYQLITLAIWWCNSWLARDDIMSYFILIRHKGAKFIYVYNFSAQ